MLRKVILVVCCLSILSSCSRAESDINIGISDIEDAIVVSDNVMFLSGSKKMYVLGVSDLKILKTFKKPKGSVDASLCIVESCFWSGGYSAFANLGRFAKNTEGYDELTRKVDLDLGRVHSLLLDPSGDSLIGMHSTGRVSYFSADSLEVGNTFYVSKSELYVGVIDSLTGYLFVGDGSGLVIKVDLKAKKALAESSAFKGAIIGLYDYDDEHVLVSSTDRQLTILDKATLSQKTLLAVTNSPVMTCHQPEVSKVLYCGLADGRVVSISRAGKVGPVLKLKDRVVLIDTVGADILVLGRNGELKRFALPK